MGDYFTRGCLLDCVVISIAAISVTLSDHVRQNYSFLLFCCCINICGVIISQQHYHYFPSDEPMIIGESAKNLKIIKLKPQLKYLDIWRKIVADCSDCNAVKISKMTKCVKFNTNTMRNLIIGSGEVLVSVTFDDGTISTLLSVCVCGCCLEEECSAQQEPANNLKQSHHFILRSSA